MSLPGFTIGIATYNRWEDLTLTLERIFDFFDPAPPIVIVDDGSPVPPSSACKRLLARTTFLRDGNNRGYIARRNQIARVVATPLYLSLDDDSFPVSGSIEPALERLALSPHVSCIGFPVTNHLGNPEVASAYPVPYRCRQFIGCAHLLRTEPFLATGGYREALVHQGEETDIAARWLQAGLDVWHEPSMAVVHHYTVSHRSWDRMDRYGARNRWLWNDWFLPVPARQTAQARLLGQRILLALRTRRSGHLRGIAAGIRDARTLRAERARMTPAPLADWRVLPVW